MILALSCNLIKFSAVNSYFLKCFLGVMKGLPLIDSCELENKKKKLWRKRVRLSLGVQQETVLYALQQSLLNSILQFKIVSFQSKISA